MNEDEKAFFNCYENTTVSVGECTQVVGRNQQIFPVHFGLG